MKDEIDELNHIGDGRILATKDELLTLKKKWEHQSFLDGEKFGIESTMKTYKIPKAIVTIKAFDSYIVPGVNNGYPMIDKDSVINQLNGDK